MGINENKRIFFALKILAPWFRNGQGKKILKHEMRHITLCFLGQTDWSRLKSEIPKLINILKFNHPIYGYFKQLISLPPYKSRVLALDPLFLEFESEFISFQKNLETALFNLDFISERSDKWVPHVSLVRSPFNFFSWKKEFQSIPFLAKNLTIYESLGNLKYQSLYEIPIPSPYLINKMENTLEIFTESEKSDLRNFQLLLGILIELNLPFPSFISSPLISNSDFEKVLKECLKITPKFSNFEIIPSIQTKKKSLKIHLNQLRDHYVIP